MPSAAVVISGFPSSNRVPGPYGEVLYGVGYQSAASLPIGCLCVGLKTAAGTITPDVQVQKILSIADADNYAGAGSEGACMLYDALTLAGNAGIPLYYASPTPAGGAVAANTTIKITGTATAPGAVIVRVNGKPLSQGIAVNDTGATIVANLALLIAGANAGRLPLTASSATSYCTVTSKTAGVRSMQHVIFLDTTQLPAGITAVLYTTWTTATTYAIGDQVVPRATPNGFYFRATAITTGISGGSEPVWPTTIGTTVVDGGVTWTCWGNTATGNVPTTALFLGNGSGIESYTNLLATLTTQWYGRVALAANDAASDGAWKAQVDVYAAAPNNFLQHVHIASNSTLASAQSVAQTTLNDQRFVAVWMLNSETHPSRIAAGIAAIRAMVEQGYPGANYNDYAISTVAPQSQQADWPSLAVQISALNNGVSVMGSWLNDGYARVVRLITTHSLTGGNPDYSTFDTAQAYVPDFVLIDAKLQWIPLAQNNPVCRDNPLPTERPLPSGVLTPDRAVAQLTGRLVDFSQGILAGTSQTVPPLVLPPQPGDVSGTFDSVANRIMVAENVRVYPNNAQIGVSIRQLAQI